MFLIARSNAVSRSERELAQGIIGAAPEFLSELHKTRFQRPETLVSVLQNWRGETEKKAQAITCRTLFISLSLITVACTGGAAVFWSSFSSWAASIS